MTLNLLIRTERELEVPTYANETDACMDLKASIGENSTIVIEPGETKVIGSGLRCVIPEEHVMLMFVRSSTGIKKNLCLANGTGIIDAGYRDEIKMALHNFGNTPVVIADGERVCQFMVIPRPKLSLLAATDEELAKGNRGGGIGSTGR